MHYITPAGQEPAPVPGPRNRRGGCLPAWLVTALACAVLVVLVLALLARPAPRGAGGATSAGARSGTPAMGSVAGAGTGSGTDGPAPTPPPTAAASSSPSPTAPPAPIGQEGRLVLVNNGQVSYKGDGTAFQVEGHGCNTVDGSPPQQLEFLLVPGAVRDFDCVVLDAGLSPIGALAVKNSCLASDVCYSNPQPFAPIYQQKAG